MNFRIRHESDEPDINLIPMIDVLLVVLIFLFVSTTFVKRSALSVQLPTGQSQATAQKDLKPITIRIDKDGQYALSRDDSGNNKALSAQRLSASQLRDALQTIAAEAKKNSQGDNDNLPLIRIEADAEATHQAVVSAMDLAANLGLNKLAIITAKR